MRGADRGVRDGLGEGGFLIKAEKISGGVAEGGDRRGAARRIRLWGFHDYSTEVGKLRDDGIDIVDPDVGEKPRLVGDLAAGDPGAADRTCGIIEAGTRGVPVADVPAEYVFIEDNGLLDVERGNFQITQARAA